MELDMKKEIKSTDKISEGTLHEILLDIKYRLDHLEDIEADNRDLMVRLIKQSNSVVKFLAQIDLEPMEIPLFRDNKVDRKLFMHILIEVRKGQDENIVNDNLIRIIDSFLTYVHALNALNIKPGVGDRAFLKQRLLVKAKEIVGHNVITDLLFVNIFERPFN